MGGREKWVSRCVAVAATVSWALASGLDVLSMLFGVQFGGTFAFARYHPAESFLIYAGMRVLVALVVWLAAATASKHWRSTAKGVWIALTALSLVTAIVAWLRLYQS